MFLLILTCLRQLGRTVFPSQCSYFYLAACGVCAQSLFSAVVSIGQILIAAAAAAAAAQDRVLSAAAAALCPDRKGCF